MLLLGDYPRVPMPSYAKIGKRFVYMLKRSSPYDDVNGQKGIVNIGHLDKETGELIADQWGYVIYVDRDARTAPFKPLWEIAKIMTYGTDLQKILEKLGVEEDDEEEYIEEDYYEDYEEDEDPEEAGMDEEDPYKHLDITAIGMVCDKFYDETKTMQALVEAFGEEDAIRVGVIAGTYLRYNAVIMNYLEEAGTCNLQGFDPVLLKEDTWEICQRLARNRDAYLHAMRSTYPDAPLTLIRMKPRIEIIDSKYLPWGYAAKTWFSKDCVSILHDAIAVLDRSRWMTLGVVPIEDRYVSSYASSLEKILAPYAQENLQSAGLLLDESDYTLEEEAYRAMLPSRNLTISLSFNEELYKKAKALEQLNPEDEWKGMPGHVAMMTDYTYGELHGHLLLGLSMDLRKGMQKNARSYFAALRRRLSRLDPEYIPLAYGGEYFHTKIKEGSRRPALVEKKDMTDAYKEYAGYYAIFTTDMEKTEDELVLDYFELQFTRDYYTGAWCFAEEWYGFKGDYREVMDGMLLPMILKDNMDLYWMRRLSGNEVFKRNGYSVRNMFYGLQHITIRNYSGALEVKYSNKFDSLDSCEFDHCDEKVLLAFGFTEQDAMDYAQRILDTPGYFHEQEALRKE